MRQNLASRSNPEYEGLVNPSCILYLLENESVGKVIFLEILN